MLVWEAHRDLAACLGDSSNISLTNIYSGARFTKQARDNYLYRAILEILKQALQLVSYLPKSRMADYLSLIFPTQIKSINLGLSDFQKSYDIQSNKNWLVKYSINIENYINTNIEGNNSKPLNILSVQASELLNGNPMIIPLPLKNSLERIGKINSRIAQRPDTFAERVNNELWIWDCYGNMDEEGSISIIYLPYPRNPANAIPVPVTPKVQGQYYYDDILDIEENMLQKMFSYALLYAMTDDQNSDNAGLISVQIQLEQNQQIQQGGQ